MSLLQNNTISCIKSVKMLLSSVQKLKEWFRKSCWLVLLVTYLQSCSLAMPNSRIHLVSLYADLNSKDGWA